MIRVALIGPPGSGKSSVGRNLAETLGVSFVDLDQVIVDTEHHTIPEIMTQHGESGFREAELRALTSLRSSSKPSDAVLATGGGVVVTPNCRTELHRHWVCVYLEASLPTLVERLAVERDSRPLLRGNEPLDVVVERLIAPRRPLYLDTAHIVVPVDNRSVDQVVSAIVDRLPNLDSMEL